MTYSTTNTYSMKRKIIRFSEKISATLARPERNIMVPGIRTMDLKKIVNMV